MEGWFSWRWHHSGMHLITRLRFWAKDITHLPWGLALRLLRERFAQDRLGLTASSLTFTTVIALVPMIAVALAIFTAFPVFAKFQDVVQKWLVASLVPDAIARQVLGYLTFFAGKANKLGSAGLVALGASALALVFTIDRTLNNIWRVRTPRGLGQRLLIYWSALTLGPVFLGISISLTSYAITANKTWVGGLPGGVGFFLDGVQFLLVAAGTAGTFYFVPNTHVRWGHAWMGGFFVAIGLEIARRLLALYIASVPTYSIVYGAFATVPILLIWIYIAWVIVLLGAALTAYVPSLLAGVPLQRKGAGQSFQLALEIVKHLDDAHQSPEKGKTLEALCLSLRADLQQVEPIIERLVGIDWVAQINEERGASMDARFVLLIDPDKTHAAQFLSHFLLSRNAMTDSVWKLANWEAVYLRALI